MSAKDWITMLPESLKAPLRNHLGKVKAIHERDLAEGWGQWAEKPGRSIEGNKAVMRVMRKSYKQILGSLLRFRRPDR